MNIQKIRKIICEKRIDVKNVTFTGVIIEFDKEHVKLNNWKYNFSVIRYKKKFLKKEIKSTVIGTFSLDLLELTSINAFITEATKIVGNKQFRIKGDVADLIHSVLDMWEMDKKN